MTSAVKVDRIGHSYDSVKALNNISFEVEPGELFGIIGPDGSGKTSLFRILTTLLIPEAGRAEVEGFDVVKEYKKIRQIVGYMPGRFSLYQDLSVLENLSFFASVFNTTIEENYHLVKDIYSQIEPFKDRRAGKLSGGMKQKLALSCALIHSPKVLFLDEPTTGVDAVSRKEFWEMLKKLQKKGISILVSTPYMDEAELCDRVALMQKGKVLTIETPQQIMKDYPYLLAGIRTNNMYDLVNDLRADDHITAAFRFGEQIHFYTKDDHLDIDGIRNRLAKKGHDEIAIEEIDAGVEDCFMALMIDEDE